MSSVLAGWPTKPLCEVAEIERNSVSPEKIKDGSLYVGLENITSEGQFDAVREVTNGELASNKFTFTPRHVLYGKLRPYLSKIARPEFSGICSTDILPILAGDELDRSFLYYFLRQPEMVQFATTRSTGANLPRLSPKKLAQFPVPIPELKEQERIAAILDKADEIRRQQRKRIAVIKTFRQSLLLHSVLNDPQSSKWDEKPLSSVAVVSGGIALSSRRGGLPKQVPYLRVANVYRGRLKLDEIKTLGLTDAEFEKTRLLRGDVLVVEGHGNRNEVGRSAIWDGSIPNCVHQNHLIRVRPDTKLLNSVYLSGFLNSHLGRRQLIRDGKTTSGLNTINLTNVRGTRIVIPPLDLQNEIAEQDQALAKLNKRLNTGLGEANSLFNSLVQRAFKGEL